MITRVRRETNDTGETPRVSDDVVKDCINQALTLYAEKEPEKKSMSLALSAQTFEYNPKATDTLFKRPVRLFYKDDTTGDVSHYGMRYDDFADRLMVDDPDTITATLYYKAFFAEMTGNNDVLSTSVKFDYLLDAILHFYYDYLYRKTSAGQSDAISTDTSRLKSRKVGDVEEDYAVEAETKSQAELLQTYSDQAATYKTRFDSHFKQPFFCKM
jgi:hypothetical protein